MTIAPASRLDFASDTIVATPVDTADYVDYIPLTSAPAIAALNPHTRRRKAAVETAKTRPANKPASRSRSTTRPPGAPLPLPLAPVRVIRVGEPGIDHPLRPITEPEALTAGDPTQVAATVVRAAVEVLDGRRSLNQIRGWLTPEVAQQLAERTRLELAIPDRGEPMAPVRIRKVHMVRFGDRAEATVIIDMADRTRAAAARLEARSGAWRVSVLEIA